MIVIVDYDTGNLRSVENSLKRLGASYRVSSDPAVIAAAERVILPGVGEAATAMANLRAGRLPEVIRGLRQPVLGICIGLQLMCRSSEEGATECMGIFDAEVKRFTGAGPDLKIPHMGWNTIEGPSAQAGGKAGSEGRTASRDLKVASTLAGPSFAPAGAEAGFSTPLLRGIREGEFVYFVHSYAPSLCEGTVAVTEYDRRFSAAIARGNFFGTQFHPEKSGSVGERIMRNFLTL